MRNHANIKISMGSYSLHGNLTKGATNGRSLHGYKRKRLAAAAKSEQSGE